MERIVVTGGTGFIGSALVRLLAEAGYEVVVLTRRGAPDGPTLGGRLAHVRWDGRTAAGWGHLADGALGIVNLAGESLADGRWSEDRKERIATSRIQAGEAVLAAVFEAAVKPRVVVQGSAIGYYGHQPASDPLTESAPHGRGFLAELCVHWEDSTRAVETLGVRRVVVRTGLVLGRGGVLDKILPPFKAFVGGPVGDGRQGVSWVHLQDEVRAIKFLLETGSATGPYNLTAPEAVDMNGFSAALGTVLHRPAWMRVPAAALRAIYGEMADEVLLNGQTVRPARLQEAGFVFRFPSLRPALKDILG
jgi:uncharacterized protein (TIGR01777 family)